MSKYLEQLMLLSKIDQEINGFEPKMRNISRTLKDAENKIAKFGAELNNLENEIQDVESQKVQNNAHVSGFSAEIKELSKKSGAVKTEEEANALEIEEDIAKEQLDAANDEIVRLNKILEDKELFKKELLEEKTGEEQNLDEVGVGINSQIDGLEKERMNVCTRKTRLVAETNQKALSLYERIRKWAKNTAIVPVKKQACYGCFMKVYDKTYLPVIKGEEIITCPHYGRILHKGQEDQD